jgi:y4mF family transcriptional regulator
MHFTARTSNILHTLSPTELLDMSDLGKQIINKRKQLKISQADLAEMSGVSLRTVNAIENGKANPSIDVLSKVLEPLGLVITLQERVPTTSNSKYRIRLRAPARRRKQGEHLQKAETRFEKRV